MRYLVALIMLNRLVTLRVVQSTGVVANKPQAQLNTLCLVDLTGLPIPVRFEESTTLTKAIKEAGIPRERMKDEVEIMRRHKDGLVQLTKINFKRIEKRTAEDFTLDQHDMVFLIPKKNEKRADLESIGRGCVACGCRSKPGTHGSFLVPKAWSDSNEAAKDDPDPNNKKP